MLDTLTAADFQPRVDQTFRLAPDVGDAFEAVLTEVVEHGESAEGQRAPFSVFFNAPLGTTAPQGTFRVEHDDLDALELFLVPVQQDAGGEGTQYQAVFS